MRWLEEHNRGLVVGLARVPIVPAAVLFDLWLGDARSRPDAATGYAACAAAGMAAPAQGSHGAGLGATVGKLFGIARACRGGIGTASLRAGGYTVGALVAVNAIGDVLDEQGQVLAGARAGDGRRFADTTRLLLGGAVPARVIERTAGHATTIGVVATDARLDNAAATQLAALAHHGMGRAVSPITANDGDTLFALATGGADQAASPAADLSTLGALAAEAVSRAIRNAVRAAVTLQAPPLPYLPAARDLAAGG
jgi:L-aminopeptidase/D-esterase-like protein